MEKAIFHKYSITLIIAESGNHLYLIFFILYGLWLSIKFHPLRVIQS